MGAEKIRKQRPHVADYHDYRTFLKDWFQYLEQDDSAFSLRSLAREADVGVSTLSMVLSGQRSLSSATFERLKDKLKLNEREIKYLGLLRDMAEAPDENARARAVKVIQKQKSYQERHPKEFETFNYLSHWYLVAIREMSALPGFQLDAHWIQSRLREHLPIEQVQSAVEFLVTHGFLDAKSAGSKPKLLECLGGVHRLALGNFHKQMLKKTADAIDEVPRDERLILGHTLAIPLSHAEQVKDILKETLNKIEALGGKAGAADSVFHVELTLIPLTKKVGNE